MEGLYIFTQALSKLYDITQFSLTTLYFPERISKIAKSCNCPSTSPLNASKKTNYVPPVLLNLPTKTEAIIARHQHFKVKACFL